MVLPLRMSTEAFAITWLEFDKLEMPAAVFVPTWAADDYELAQRSFRAAAELEPVIGADREDFFAELEAVYRSLTTAPLEYTARIQRDDGSSFGVLVACQGRKAVRCIVDGDVAHLSLVAAGPESLVEVLSYCPPARIHSASAPLDHVTGDGNGNGPFMVNPVENVSTEVSFLRDLLDAEPISKGELGVAIRSRTGRRQSHPDKLDIADLDEVGRIAYYLDGHYLTALPGTDANLVDRLHRMHHDLA
jgi:hypothetical protein